MQNLKELATNEEIKVAILDFGMGNLFSVKQACEYAGLTPIVTSKIPEIMAADALILPGVGAFGDAMDNLKKLDIVSPIKDSISSGKPFLAICLGIQLLFTESEELGNHRGLDIFKGSVVKFLVQNNKGEKFKVPQVGWNKLTKPDSSEITWENSPLEGIKDGQYMYFVHSYYVKPEDKSIVFTETEYEDTVFCSTILNNNVCAMQYHPEKSASQGLKIYENWAKIIKESRGD